jgi:adenylate kinase family enzyme
LARQLGYPHIELDALFHQENWQPLPEDEFRQTVFQRLQGEAWVVEGSYSAVRPLILARADTVIWLDLSRAEVMRQLIPRTLMRVICRTRLWNGNRERWQNLFRLSREHSILAWAWQRHAVYRKRYRDEMCNAPDDVRYLRLDSREAVDAFLARLST